MTALENAIQKSRDIVPRTKELYLQHVRAFLMYAGTAKADWTTEKAIEWRDSMKKRRIRPQSVNVALNALRFAAKHARLDFVESIATLPVRATAPQAKALTLRDAYKLADACGHSQTTLRQPIRVRGWRDIAIITLGLRAGMQRASICALQIDDFKLKAQTLSFIKKGGEVHTIALDPETLFVVERWVGWLKSKDVTTGPMFRSLGRSHISDETPIGRMLTADGLYRALQQRAKSANLDDLSPHVFRRTFTTWAKRAGATPSQIAAVTGHKPIGDDETSDDTRPANFLIPNFLSTENS